MSAPTPTIVAAAPCWWCGAPPDAPCAAAAGFGCVAQQVDRIEARQGRIDRLDAAYQAAKAAARPSPRVSSHIHTAPARGPMQVLRQVETVRTEAGKLHTRSATSEGQHAALRMDAFDLMALQARRRKPDAPALFTLAQVNAGRAYAALTERVSAEGVKCSSLERGHGGEGGGLDWIEGVMQRSARLDRMRAAIGDEVVLDPRGIRAQADRGRRTLGTRELVDQVCCHGRTIKQVLTRAGWARGATTSGLARGALLGALDRLWGL